MRGATIVQGSWACQTGGTGETRSRWTGRCSNSSSRLSPGQHPAATRQQLRHELWAIVCCSNETKAASTLLPAVVLSAAHRHTPTLVDGLWALPVVQLAAGDAHSAALTSSGHMFVWGSNHFGQLGLVRDGDPNSLHSRRK